MAEADIPAATDPYYMGLHDSVLSGWYNKDTGELARFAMRTVTGSR